MTPSLLPTQTTEGSGFEVSLWVKAKHYEVSELVLEHMMKYQEDTTVELLGFIDAVVLNKAENSEEHVAVIGNV